jgi:hypothetical protein
MRPGFKGGTDALYLTLYNSSGAPDRLIGARSPAAAQVSLHESRVVGGVAQMRSLPSIPVPAHGAVVLSPGGRHIMLVGLRSSLRVGDRVPVVLIFAHQGAISAQALVRAGAPAASMPSMPM